MQKAAFSITNYYFDKVEIDLSNHTNKELSLSFAPSGLYDNKEASFELDFEVNVFDAKNSNNKPFVFIRCKSLFKLENVSSFQDIPDFFYKNSIAILFPYVRAYLSLITTQANIPGIILPVLNLSNLEDELKKNTAQK